ncbi:hypothetical protein [Shouchella miscanthi]|uniref:hypothetical protein n=1 Tax=Shouchella miscanthi TaxID=2598861 RepID=UPI0011A79E10|nr:hypothetical protein [Shouchella miscanthi]
MNLQQKKEEIETAIQNFSEERAKTEHYLGQVSDELLRLSGAYNLIKQLEDGEGEKDGSVENNNNG